jgi:S1-C subfamily serine protease
MTDVNALPIHLSAALAGLAAKATPSIVSVRSHRSQSSGFAWRPGLVVTADEALSEEGEFAVTVPGGDSVPAQLVGRDPTTDVALLRIDRSDLPPLPLTATSLAVGALAVGSDDGAPIAALGTGAMVMSVDPKGPGAAAGVHQGDVIVALNGEPIRRVQSLLRALGPDRVGQTVTLDLRRAGETRQLSLTIGERPAA